MPEASPAWHQMYAAYAVYAAYIDGGRADKKTRAGALWRAGPPVTYLLALTLTLT
jgi:hypothetical protein